MNILCSYNAQKTQEAGILSHNEPLISAHPDVRNARDRCAIARDYFLLEAQRAQISNTIAVLSFEERDSPTREVATKIRDNMRAPSRRVISISQENGKEFREPALICAVYCC